jgi:hypothetical protein
MINYCFDPLALIQLEHFAPINISAVHFIFGLEANDSLDIILVQHDGIYLRFGLSTDKDLAV